jgi:hypothetical protein
MLVCKVPPSNICCLSCLCMSLRFATGFPFGLFSSCLHCYAGCQFMLSESAWACFAESEKFSIFSARAFHLVIVSVDAWLNLVYHAASGENCVPVLQWTC